MADKSFKIKNSLNLDPQAVAPTNPIAGDLYYDSAATKLKYYDGLGFNNVGAGGPADASIISVLQSDSDITTWITANQATLSNAEFAAHITPLVGTWVKQNATTPINGTYSYTYTGAAANTGDYVVSEVIAIPLRSRGKEIGITIPFMYNGVNDDMKLFVWDVTNDVALSSSLDLVKNQITVTANQLCTVFVPPTCTQIRIGYQVLVVNTGKILKFDDVQVSDNPYTYKNLNDYQEIYLPSQGTLFQNTSSGNLRMVAAIPSRGANLITQYDTGAYTQWQNNTGSKIVVNYSVSAPVSSASNRISANHSTIGALVSMSDNSSGGSAWTSLSGTATLWPGEYLYFSCTSSRDNTAGVLQIQATSESTNVVTPAKVGMESWTIKEGQSSLTDRSSSIQFSASATVEKNGSSSSVADFASTNNLIYHDRTTDPSKFYATKDVQVSGVFYGYPTAAGDAVYLYIDGVAIQGVSSYTVGAGVENAFSIFLKKGSYFSIGASGGGLYNNSTVCELKFNAVAYNAQFLAAIPITKTAYIKEVQPNGVGSGTATSGAWYARPINVINDTGANSGTSAPYVSLSGNDFTIQPGKYSFEFSSPFFKTDEFATRLWNVTNAAVEVDGQPGLASSAYNGHSNSIILYEFTLSSPKTFRVEYRVAITRASNGLGSSGGGGWLTNDTFGTGKLTKHY